MVIIKLVMIPVNLRPYFTTALYCGKWQVTVDFTLKLFIKGQINLNITKIYHIKGLFKHLNQDFLLDCRIYSHEFLPRESYLSQFKYKLHSSESLTVWDFRLGGNITPCVLYLLQRMSYLSFTIREGFN